MDDALEERVEALERTVADGEFDHEQLAQAELQDRLSTIESQLETVESRLEELEAGTQALRGYVGNVRAVNDDVEQRAETALAKVEALESSLHDGRTLATDKGEPATGQTSNSASSAARSTRSPSTGPTPDSDGQPPAQTGGQTPSSGPNRTDGSRCQSCGRKHEPSDGGGSENTESTLPGATDGGPSLSSDASGGGTTGEKPLVPDESEETGTLRRIRELL